MTSSLYRHFDVAGTLLYVGVALSPTYRLAQHAVEARELDLVTVVGKSEPIRIYELLGRIGEIDAARRSPDERRGARSARVARRTPGSVFGGGETGPALCVRPRCAQASAPCGLPVAPHQFAASSGTPSMVMRCIRRRSPW